MEGGRRRPILVIFLLISPARCLIVEEAQLASLFRVCAKAKRTGMDTEKTAHLWLTRIINTGQYKTSSQI